MCNVHVIDVQISCSGVFEVRLESELDLCAECNGTYRLCFGHYQVLAAAPVGHQLTSSAPPVCSYGTLTTRLTSTQLNYSQTTVDFPFAFSWPVSITTVSILLLHRGHWSAVVSRSLRSILNRILNFMFCCVELNAYLCVPA